MQNEKMVSKKVSDMAEYSNFFIRLILYVILCLYQCFQVSYDFAYQIYGDVAVSSKATVDKDIKIEAGDSSMAIANKLSDEGMIVNKYSFLIRLKLSQQAVQPNIYKVSNNMTYSEIIDTITDIDENEIN